MKYTFKEIAFNSTEKRIPVEEDRFTYIGLEHLDSRKLSITRYGSDVPLKGEKLVMRKGDILFGKRNTYLKRVAIAPFDGLFSAHGMVLRPNEKVISREFFPFFLSSDYFLDEAIRISVGSLSPTVNWKDLKDLEFEIPDFDRQHKIAEVLSAANNLKESYEAMITATDEMVKSQFISQFGNPVTNPMGWPTKPMCQVAPESPSNIKMKGRVWVLNLDMIESNSGNIINKVFEDSGDLNSVTAFDEGNVLFSKLRPYLNKVTIPDGKGYATTELVPLRPNTKELRQYFLSFLLRTDEFVKYADGIATGTKMPRMPMTALREFKCILPPTEQQDKFCGISKRADKSKFELKKAIEKIDKVMRALML